MALGILLVMALKVLTWYRVRRWFERRELTWREKLMAQTLEGPER
jgi:hypothetical protein